MLKLKITKETWNQASRIEVRGGLLGYEDQSTSEVKVLLVSKYCSWSKYCLCMKKSQSTSKIKDYNVNREGL